jgi:uncharacterized protein YkwD
MRHFFILGFVFLTATLVSLNAFAQGYQISDDDGTYKTITVTSPEKCTALCEADKKCRGAVTFQADTSKAQMQCRLNDGLSKTSPFEIKPPAPLSLDIALRDLNIYRAENGLTPVNLNEKLNRASQVHAEDLAKHGLAAHIGTDGSTHGERVQKQAYYFSTARENVATGQKSWEAVFQAWKDSPGHNQTLLADDVEDFGIALVYEPTTVYTTYWTMLMAQKLPGMVHPTSAITAEQRAILNTQN